MPTPPLDEDGLARARARAAHASKANVEAAAVRAIDDPRRLAQAARIVRAALERRRFALADVLPDADQPDEAA
jgi:hypothetical protein